MVVICTIFSDSNSAFCIHGFYMCLTVNKYYLPCFLILDFIWIYNIDSNSLNCVGQQVGQLVWLCWSSISFLQDLLFNFFMGLL
jgi:hypothetical protein